MQRPLPDPDAIEQARVAAAQARIAAARVAFLKRVPRRIRGQQKDIKRCFEQTLRLQRNVGGFIDIEFVVGPDGAVSRASVTRNTTGSKTLGSCISGVFLSIRFPRPPGGAVSLRYPFRFSAKSR